MTLTNSTRLVVATGNGATTEWPFGFLVPTEADLRVSLSDGVTVTPLDDNAYGISGIGNSAGGTVTYPLSGAPLTSATQIIIERSVQFTQETSFQNQQRFFPAVLEAALDRTVMQTQENRDRLTRTLAFPPGAPVPNAQEFVADATQAVRAAQTAAGAAETAAETAAADAVANAQTLIAGVVGAAEAAAQASETARDQALTAYQGRQYGPRADFVTDVTVNGYSPAVGTVVTFDGLQAQKVEGVEDVMGGLPGWVPFGIISIGQFVDLDASSSTARAAALQNSVNYAASLELGFPVSISLQGYDLFVADTTFFNGRENIRVHNGTVRADPEGDWAAVGGRPPAILDCNGAGTHKIRFENLLVECSGVASGIRFQQATNCKCADVSVHGMAANGYGIGSFVTATNLRLNDCTANQFVFGEDGFDIQANRTAVGFDMNTADFTMISCLGYYCLYPIRKTGAGSYQITASHFYNGAMTTVTEQAYNAYILDAPNGIFSGNYWDNGAIRIESTETTNEDAIFRMNFSGDHCIKNANGSNTCAFEIVTAAPDTTLRGLSITGLTCAGQNTEFRLLTTGSGSYVADFAKRCYIQGIRSDSASEIRGLPNMVPRVIFGSSTVNPTDASGVPATGGAATLSWRREGNWVTVNYSASNINTTGLEPTDDLRIPLPFPAASGSVGSSAGAAVIANINHDDNAKSIVAQVAGGNSFARLTEVRDGGGISSVSVSDLTSGSASIFCLTLNYIAS